MAQPEFITGTRPENKGLDFEYLKSEGIRHIQALTGAFWTDYNAHDPGVTILEQLCYALTDLSYRIDFDIQDLLFGRERTETAFHLPQLILPSNALTLIDYRKLMLDSIPDLKNIWLTPTQSHENSLGGLYHIFLDVDERLPSKRKENLVQEVRHTFCQNRNLSEDVEAIQLLEPVYISVYAQIEVDKVEEIEHILAEIFFQIQEYLNPEVHFYSLDELLKAGYPLQEIYEGPVLKHGFIKQEDLLPKLEKVVISELIKIIMQVTEVISVKNLYLKVEEEIYDNQFVIARHQIPRLVFNHPANEKDFTVSFYKGNIHYDEVDLVRFRRKLNELQSANKRIYRPNEDMIEISRGRQINLEEYYSIQNQFPLIYGISEYGLNESATPERKAQAKQLKGYLMVFEQTMANYLAQLAHVKDLFSLKAQVKQTYFSQKLDQVPEAHTLYIRDKETKIRDVQLGETEITQDYERGLEQLIRMQDDFTERRNRFLDFLLAIHGEVYWQYSISQKNYYFDEEAFGAFLVENKTRFLQNLPEINKNKAKAFNYLEANHAKGNIAGLEAKINILLGLNATYDQEEGRIFRRKPIFETFEARDIKVIREEGTHEALAEWWKATDPEHYGLDRAQIENHWDWIDEADLSDLNNEKPIAENLLSKTVIYRQKLISTEFLKHALYLENYRLGSLTTDSSHYFLLFQHPEQGRYYYVAEFTGFENALRGTQAFIHLVRDLNMQSEGFYQMEHILLRPDVRDQKFGFYLRDETGHNFLKSTRRYTFAERLQVVQALKATIFQYENYSVERRGDGDFEIRFLAEEESIELRSLRAYESVQEIHEKMDRVYAFLSDQDEVRAYDEKFALYVQNSDEDRQVPEEFFAYQLTTVLPDWTARFQNAEFRLVVEELIHENKPAHVHSSTLWLDIQEMKRFESLYDDWASEKQKNGLHNKERLERLCNHFIQFLLQLYQKHQPERFS